MLRKRETRARKERMAALADEEREKKEAMRAALLANETPEERAEREAREAELAREQAARWEREFWDRKERG
jgi:hypothetical protein